MSRNVSIIILYNDDKKILLQHRSKDAKRLPNYWGFFGGGIEKGETPEEALYRESWEELKYKPQKAKLIFIHEYKYQNTVNKMYIYIEKIPNNTTLKQDEGQGMGWFLPNECKNLKMIAHDIEVINKIKDQY